jgi:hypothetical protein
VVAIYALSPNGGVIGPIPVVKTKQPRQTVAGAELMRVLITSSNSAASCNIHPHSDHVSANPNFLGS